MKGFKGIDNFLKKISYCTILKRKASTTATASALNDYHFSYVIYVIYMYVYLIGFGQPTRPRESIMA